MINIAFTVLSLVVLSVAIVTRTSQLQFPPELQEEVKESVLATETSIPEPSSVVEPFPTTETAPTVSPTTTEVPQVVETSTEEAQLVIDKQSEWKYPNSIDNLSENTYAYVSTDSPNKIFDWYKNKVLKDGYNVTSLIYAKEVSIEEEVKGKIVASLENQGVTIETKTNLATKETQITIDIAQTSI